MSAQVQLVMPKYGMGMVSGTIVQWLKREGERVEAGVPLLVIETDKVNVEVEAPFSGVLQKVLATEGQEVPCGETAALLLADEDVSETQVAMAGRASQPSTPAPTPTASRESVARAQISADMPISPIALKIATERGLDLAGVKGTGPGGRIVKEDVLRALEEKPAPAGDAGELEPLEVIPLRGTRKTISERMRLSRQRAAHFTIFMDVDMTEAVRLRSDLQHQSRAAGQEGPTLNDLVVAAVARALAEHPRINCSIVDNEIRVWKQINVGVAVDTERGLIVPVIHEAAKKTLHQVSERARDLVKRAREGTLGLADVSGGTFTITNLGSLGAETFAPIINYPESAILGVGRVAEKPAVFEGGIAIRSMMTLGLSIDHRAIDGAPGTRFLTTVKSLLETPGRLAE